MATVYVLTTGADSIVSSAGPGGDIVVVTGPTRVQPTDVIDLRRTGAAADSLEVQGTGDYVFNQGTGGASFRGIETIGFFSTAAGSRFAYGDVDARPDGGVLQVNISARDTRFTASLTALTEGRTALDVSVGPGADTVGGSRFDDRIVSVFLTNGFNGADLLLGFGGNDYITAGPGGSTISGGDGNDVLITGNGADSIDAGRGNDSISGDYSLTPDTILGGEGADTLRADGFGDRFDGGADNDLMLGAVIAVDSANARVPAGATFVGGAGADTLIGEFGADWMLSTDALDRFLLPLAGDDLWQITVAMDIAWDGSFGNDTMITTDGAATFLGGQGADVMLGGAGLDRFEGGLDGDLFVDIGGGADTVFGFDGADTAIDGPGDLRFEGGTGDDLFRRTTSLTTHIESIAPLGTGDTGGAAALPLLPGGADTFLGEAGDDTLEGNQGNDLFLPGSGQDSFAGGSGNDTVVMAFTDLTAGDTLDGGAGFDLLRLTAPPGTGLRTLAFPTNLQITGFEAIELIPATPDARLRWVLPDALGVVSLRLSAASEILDGRGATMAHHVTGGEGHDTLLGGAAADTLEGGAGSDRLTDTAGANLMFGGDGADTLDGGAGRDQLLGEAGDDRLRGGDGEDFLSGGTGRDTVLGGAGDDAVTVRLADLDAFDLLAGGAGTDLLRLDALTKQTLSAATADRLSGFEVVQVHATGTGAVITLTDAMVDSIDVPLSVTVFGDGVTVDGSRVQEGALRMFAQGSATTLIGGAGDDALFGAVGSTELLGGGGADTLVGSVSATTVQGGDGDDLVWLSRGLLAGDSLDGGAGRDTLAFTQGTIILAGDYARALRFEVLALADAFNEVVLAASDVAVRGSPAPEIRGGASTDYITLSALSAGQRVFGGAGDDALTGGRGGDRLDAGTGSDVVQGGAGNDTITFGDFDGTDVAEGGAGVDWLVLDLGARKTGAALLNGMSGFEVLDVTMAGGRLTLPASMTSIVPTPGQPAFTVVLRTVDGPASILDLRTATATVVEGGAGRDRLLGSAFGDTLSGGAGDDLLQGGGGADLLDLTDGGADVLRWASLQDGTRLSVSAKAAAADQVVGFGGEDRIELSRAAFGTLPLLTQGAAVGEDLPVALGGTTFLFFGPGDAVADPLDQAGLAAMLQGRLQPNGVTGDASFLVVPGSSAGSGALYWLRDGNDDAVLNAGDVVVLLATFSGGLPTDSNQFVLI